MKPGLVASAVLHSALLTWGLWSFSAPEAFDVAQVEALPVDIVPFEELSQATLGELDAPVTETPAPTPTQKSETLPMPAENVGENEVDLDTPPTPVERPRPVEQAAAAAPPPLPQPEPEPEPEPVPEEPAAEPAPPEPTPAEPEVAQAPAEPEPIEPDAVEQAIAAAAEAEPSEQPVPQNVPVPASKPRPPEPVRVERPEPPKTEPREEEETEVAEQTTPEESEFDADKIAALLNKEQPAGGGAKRSVEQASLGTDRRTGATLSQSEIDALRGQIQRCWSPPAGVSEAGSLRITIAMKLDQSGQLQGVPEITSGSGASMIERVAGEAALRAVRRCAPYNLPIDKYDTWADVKVNFDPSEMF